MPNRKRLSLDADQRQLRNEIKKEQQKLSLKAELSKLRRGVGGKR